MRKDIMAISRPVEHEKTNPIQTQIIQPPALLGSEIQFEKIKPISWFIVKTREGKLKKQSQFVPAENHVKPYRKGYYSNKPAFRVEENKANQTQFLYR